MASTATAFFPGSSSFPNTTQYAGQGLLPIARCRLSFDDASASIPAWTEVANSKFRSFSVSRGRESELQQFDAGTATVVLDNRDRAYDPTSNASIRPMNRVWLYEEFSGEVHDLFKGYAESWNQEWPGWGGSDAIATISATDEFKVLNLNALPVTDPPRDSYDEVVEYDDPAGFWPMTEDPSLKQAAGTPGTALLASASISSRSQALIAGATDTSLTLPATTQMTTGDLNDGDPGDPSGLAEFGFEMWFLAAALPTVSADLLAAGPRNAGFAKWLLQLNTAGTLTLTVRTAANAAVTVTAGTILAGSIYHIVGTITGGNLRLYVNGSQVGSTAWASTFTTSNDAGAGDFFIGDGGSEADYTFARLAFYRAGLSSTRVAAHYTAGAQRGFVAATLESAKNRVGAVLDSISSAAPRTYFASNTRVVPSTYMHGQAALDELRTVVSSQSVDAALFITASGAVLFLDASHRSSAPYNTSQVTIGDAGGTEIPYTDCSFDYSESFLANYWTVTRVGGLVQTVSDATSIAAYGKRAQSLDAVPAFLDADALTIATAMLGKYKDPMLRATRVSLSTLDAATAEAAFRRELMDKITFKRSPPGGGSRISQDLFIQKIEISGSNDGAPWTITWGVSPV